MVWWCLTQSNESKMHCISGARNVFSIDFIGMISLRLAQRKVWLAKDNKEKMVQQCIFMRWSRWSRGKLCLPDIEKYGRKSFADFGWSFKSKRCMRPRQIPLHPGRSEEMPRQSTTAMWQFNKGCVKKGVHHEAQLTQETYSLSLVIHWITVCDVSCRVE